MGTKRGKEWERDESTLAGRIVVRMEELGKKPIDLAEAAGVSESAVAQWLTGQSKNLKLEYFFAVAKFLELEPRWLGIGKGPRELQGSTTIIRRKPAAEVVDGRVTRRTTRQKIKKT